MDAFLRRVVALRQAQQMAEQEAQEGEAREYPDWVESLGAVPARGADDGRREAGAATPRGPESRECYACGRSTKNSGACNGCLRLPRKYLAERAARRAATHTDWCAEADAAEAADRAREAKYDDAMEQRAELDQARED